MYISSVATTMKQMMTFFLERLMKKDSGLQFEIQTLFMIENVDQYSHNHGIALYSSGTLLRFTWLISYF